MSNAYSEATFLRNKKMNDDISSINNICTIIHRSFPNLSIFVIKECVINLYEYGTHNQIIESVILLIKCKLFTEYVSQHKNGIHISPYAIEQKIKTCALLSE
jgi:hypothetical protein